VTGDRPVDALVMSLTGILAVAIPPPIPHPDPSHHQGILVSWIAVCFRRLNLPKPNSNQSPISTLSDPYGNSRMRIRKPVQDDEKGKD
jgi:hypothetical protein